MEVPRALDEMGPDWLSNALSAPGGPPARVDAVTWHALEVENRFAAELARGVLEPAAGSRELPTTVIAKYSSRDELIGPRERGIYEREVRIYRDHAAELGVPLPECFYADRDPGSGAFVLLLEDLAGLRGGRTEYECSLSDARLACENAARLHAAWWADPRLDGFDWLNRPMDPDVAQVRRAGFAANWAARPELKRRVLSPTLLRIGDLMCDRLADLFTVAARSPLTLNHGDYRPANLFFDERRAVAIDWQIAFQGPPAGDLANFLVWGLSPDRRRGWEGDLVSAYLQTLSATGVRGYSRDALTHDLRFGLLRALQTFAFVLANRSLDSPAAWRQVERMGSRLVALTDWDCEALLVS